MYLDPLCYGYTLDDNERLVADICSLELPDDFPLPCTCGTCARETVCPCRKKSVGCCQYCKCSKRECRNPRTVDDPRLIIELYMYYRKKVKNLVNSFVINNSEYFYYNRSVQQVSLL